MVTVDVPHVFRIFGGPKGLLRTLTRHEPDHGLTYNQVQMWLQREQIPSKWMGLVLYAIQMAGREWHEFLTDPQEMAPDTKRQKHARPRG